MATGRVIAAAVAGDEFTMFGDGRQIRDFTFVGDVARANRLAVESQFVSPGTAINIAGGSATSLQAVIDTVGEILERPVAVRVADAAAGDVRETHADTSRARRLLDWTPRVDIRAGIADHVAWYCSSSLAFR